MKRARISGDDVTGECVPRAPGTLLIECNVFNKPGPVVQPPHKAMFIGRPSHAARHEHDIPRGGVAASIVVGYLYRPLKRAADRPASMRRDDRSLNMSQQYLHNATGRSNDTKRDFVINVNAILRR